MAEKQDAGEVEIYNRSFSQSMWDDTAEIREKTIQTNFVQGTGNGNLEAADFVGYISQDIAWSYFTKENIDEVLKKTKDENQKKYLESLSKFYEGYNMNLKERWHIASAEGIYLGKACKEYVDYQRDVASTMDPIYFIIALIPGSRLFPWIGQQFREKSHGVYTEWFNYNMNPDRTGYKKMDELVDSAVDKGTLDKKQASEVYTRCMEAEYEFFNSP